MGPGGRALRGRAARAGGGLVQGFQRSLLLLRLTVPSSGGTSQVPSPVSRGERRILDVLSSVLRRRPLRLNGRHCGWPRCLGAGRSVSHRPGAARARWAGSPQRARESPEWENQPSWRSLPGRGAKPSAQRGDKTLCRRLVSPCGFQAKSSGAGVGKGH